MMVRGMLGKVLQTVLVLGSVSVAAFWFLKLAPGDPVPMLLGAGHSPAAHARLTRELGLDQPVYRLYFQWLGRCVQGDWGLSYVTRDDIFKQAVFQALPAITRCWRPSSPPTTRLLRTWKKRGSRQAAVIGWAPTRSARTCTRACSTAPGWR